MERAARSQWRELREAGTDELSRLRYMGYTLPFLASANGLELLLSGRSSDEALPFDPNYGIKKLLKGPNPEFRHEGESRATIWSMRGLSRGPLVTHPSIVEMQNGLEAEFPTIRKEFGEVSSWMETHPENGISNRTGKWSRIPLVGVKEPPPEVKARAPVTFDLLSKMPIALGYGFAFFSRTHPGTVIEPHHGSTNLRCRIHVGVSVPEPAACLLKVGGEELRWEEGKAFTFDDSYIHSSENHGSRPRDVLIVDVFSPFLAPEEVRKLRDRRVSQFGKY